MQLTVASHYCSGEISPEEQQIIIEQLQAITDSTAHENKKYNLGRGNFKEVELSNKNVIIKSYFRGGLISRFIEKTFFHFHYCQKEDCLNYRPLAELKILEKLRNLGLNVPKPLIAYIKTDFFKLSYQGAIATEKIEDSTNLLDVIKNYQHSKNQLLLQNIVKYCNIAGNIAKQVIEQGIFHSDLHLGNVLINSTNNEVYIIDFDKASYHTDHKSNIEKTIYRWKKSCAKYDLLNIADKAFIEGILK